MIDRYRIFDAHMHYTGIFMPKGEILINFMDRNNIDAAIVNTLNTKANMGLINKQSLLDLQKKALDPTFDLFSDFHTGQPDHSAVIELAKSFPNRIYPFFWYNPRDITDPTQERGLKIVKQALQDHFRGIKIQLAMTSCSMKALEPLANEINGKGIPIYIHPSGGIFGAKHTTASEIASLIMQYPEINFIIGHASYSMEFCIECLVSFQNISNIYFETSTSIPYGIITFIKVFGADHVIFGSDTPPAGPFRLEYDKIAALQISEQQKRQVLSENVESLIQLR